MVKDVIITCAQLAHEAHKGQVRKWTGRPFFEHPERVAMRAMLIPGITPEVVGAGFMHDVEEDCQHLGSEFWCRIPNGVYPLIEWLTNPSKQHPELKRYERKQIDREHITKAPVWARVLKVIDRTDNLTDMLLGAPEDFMRLYARESTLLHDAIANTITWQGDPLDTVLRDLCNEMQEAIAKVETAARRYDTIS